MTDILDGQSVESLSNTTQDQGIRSFIDEYNDHVMIMTDRMLANFNWTLDDIVTIDELYHVRDYSIPGSYNIQANQCGILFKNRFKLIIVEQNSATSLTNCLNSEIILPEYVYLIKTITKDSGKEQYLKNNIVIHDHINIYESGFGINTNMSNLMTYYIIRIILNSAIRDLNADEITSIINNQLSEFIKDVTDAPNRQIEKLNEFIEMSSSDLFDQCLSIIIKYDMFNTTVLNCHRIDTIMTVLENIYDDIDPHTGKRHIIGIRSSFLMFLTLSSDLSSLITVTGRILRHSQFCNNKDRRYEIINIDNIQNLLEFIKSYGYTPKIVDLARDVNAHRFLSWIWKRYNYPGKRNPKNKRKNTLKKRQWNNVKSIFEHSLETMFTSLQWVMLGMNTPEDAKDYIRSVLLDPITLPYVKDTWKELYEAYFDNTLSYAFMTIKNSITLNILDWIFEFGEHSSFNCGDDRSLLSLVINNVISVDKIGYIFRRITVTLNYLNSLKDIVIDFDAFINGHRTIDNKSNCLDWKHYQNISIFYDKCFCLNQRGPDTKCEDDCICNLKQHCILTCNANIDVLKTIDNFFAGFDKTIIFVPFQDLIDFTDAYSKLTFYHYSSDGISHMLDRDNIKSILYVKYLLYILNPTKLLSVLIDNLNIIESKFDLNERGIDRFIIHLRANLKKSADKINRDDIKLILKFLITNFIETFLKIKIEASNISPKILDSNNKSKIVKLAKSNVLVDICELNDLVGMTYIVLGEIKTPINLMKSINKMFIPSILDKSICKRISKIIS